MITMELLGKIERLYFRDKKSLHDIAKYTGLSRNTIRKWVRTHHTPISLKPMTRFERVRVSGELGQLQLHSAIIIIASAGEDGMRVFGRVRQHGIVNASTYLLGRFRVVRKASRLIRSALNGNQPTLTEEESLVGPFLTDDALTILGRDGVYLGLQLKPDTLALLQAFASNAERRVAHGDRQIATDETLGTLDACGQPAVIINYLSPELHALTEQVANDPQLLAVVTRHLGSSPRAVQIKVHESRVTNATTDYREACMQTVMFHYDVHALNFVYVFFYLTDVDQSSGAHELILGTHSNKRLAHLFSGARKTDDEIYGSYGGRSRSLVICGLAGTGFIEDTSCFHRALAPVKRPRLALQIRYS